MSLGKTVLVCVGVVMSIAASAAPIKENIGLYGGNVSDIEAVNRAGTTELLIAVSTSQRGVFRWDSIAEQWESVTNPSDNSITGQIAGSATLVEANPRNTGDVYTALTLSSASRLEQLYVSDNYGDLDPNVSWVAALTTAGGTIDGVVALEGHSSGIYAGTRDGKIWLNENNSTGTFSTVFTHPSGDEIVAFAVASSGLGYVITAPQSGTGAHTHSVGFWSTDWAGSDTDLSGNMPHAAPVELRTGTCPISSCDIEIEIVGVDPIDTTGNTIFIAGSSINGQAFKSSDGGLTWNDGWDYQCGLPFSGCNGFGFTDGWPQEIRFRGSTSGGTSGHAGSSTVVESRHVFISRHALDQETTSSTWESMPRLESTIQPSGVGGPTITMGTSPNEDSLAIDPIDDTVLYIATDLAVGQVEHTESGGYATPSGIEIGNAIGIEGLVVRGLDYYENSPTDKELWVVSMSGAGYATGYDPTDPTSVANQAGWVYPIFPVATSFDNKAAVEIDPGDKSLVLIGSMGVYRNPTADGSTTLEDVANNWSQVFDPDDVAFSGPGTPLESDRVKRSLTTAIEWTTEESCDRVYMTIANDDTGTEGGVFYSDDKGVSWTADTLDGALLKMPVNTVVAGIASIAPLIGVGDVDGRSTAAGIYARRSSCLGSAWYKPSHTTDATFAEIQTKAVLAIDALYIPSPSKIDGVIFVATEDSVYRGQHTPTATCAASGWDCWGFSNVTPSGATGFTDVAIEGSTDPDHIFVAYDNCIKESTDRGLTWSTYSDSCQPDHGAVKVLVYDDLIAGTSGGAYAYQIDTDADGVADTSDTDDDGDGVADTLDAFPLDGTETLDTDSDGTGNNADTDDDADGILDTVDSFPLIDVGDETDTDGDGAPDTCDAECLSTGMMADSDDDGDGVADTSDAFPLDATESVDTDGDGIGNNADSDDDGDGDPDSTDDFPLYAKSDCFIATAAFGSYENRYVMELRQFRDEHLLTNQLGTQFVDLYYEYSPPIAETIASNESLRKITRVSIYPLVGFAHTVQGLGWLGTLGIFFIPALGLVVLRKRA